MRDKKVCGQRTSIEGSLAASVHFGRFFPRFDSLHMLGIDRHDGQFESRVRTFLEADHRTDGATMSVRAGRERGVFLCPTALARTEACPNGAVIVGASRCRGTEDDCHRLLRRPTQLAFLPQAQRIREPSLIAGVGVETLLTAAPASSRPVSHGSPALPDPGFHACARRV